MKKAMRFEERLERLEEINELIDNEETALEDAMELYKEGIEHAKILGHMLTDTKEEITSLNKEVDETLEQLELDESK